MKMSPPLSSMICMGCFVRQSVRVVRRERRSNLNIKYNSSYGGIWWTEISSD